jgi:Mg2+ and Co2+ transporter CorA
MFHDGHLLLILHEPPGPDDRARTARFFWRNPAGEWLSSAHGSGPQSVRKLLGEYTKRLEQLDDDVQTAHRANDFFALLQAVVPIGRSARNLYGTLQEARELAPDDRDLISMRDLAGAIDRTAEVLHHDAKNGLDFVVARSAEEQSRRTYEMTVASHRLNVLAAIFFPLATMAALFGMNIPHGLETASRIYFWFVLLIGIMLGIGLASWVINKPPMPGDERRRKKSPKK